MRAIINVEMGGLAQDVCSLLPRVVDEDIELAFADHPRPAAALKRMLRPCASQVLSWWAGS
jgi:hypothetical protein